MSSEKLRMFSIPTIAALIVIFAVMIVAPLSAPAQVTAQQTITITDFSHIYQQVSPSVVAISVLTQANGRTIGAGTGSGFVIDKEGHIITNNHVVDDATFIEIEFFDGTLAQAEIVGLDPDSDLAVLDVDVPAERLFPLQFGNSDALIIGEPVMAIGSPYGQDWTLTTGIVSGMDRVITSLTSFSIGGVIQTDAAINPGNSGGPLLNSVGQVIGVNSQILSQSGSNSGVGFAVPGNLAQRVARSLIQNGSVEYSYIGISGEDVSLRMIQQLNLPDSTRGIIIASVVDSGPASRAGLRSASLATQVSTNATSTFDIVTAVDGLNIKGMDELISYLARATSPGQQISLTVLRNGQTTELIPVTLSARPS